MWTYSIKWNYSSNWAAVFLFKSSPRTKHNFVLLGFWLILLPRMFIPSYTTIYFFVNIFFFSNVYMSVNMIFKCYLSSGWETGHPLSMYISMGMQGVIQNVYRCIQGERGITPHVCIHSYSYSFHVFVFWCLVLLVEI